MIIDDIYNTSTLHAYRIGTCVTYFTGSDTTKNAGIGLIPIPIATRCSPNFIGAAKGKLTAGQNERQA